MERKVTKPKGNKSDCGNNVERYAPWMRTRTLPYLVSTISVRTGAGVDGVDGVWMMGEDGTGLALLVGLELSSGTGPRLGEAIFRRGCCCGCFRRNAKQTAADVVVSADGVVDGSALCSLFLLLLANKNQVIIAMIPLAQKAKQLKTSVG